MADRAGSLWHSGMRDRISGCLHQRVALPALDCEELGGLNPALSLTYRLPDPRFVIVDIDVEAGSCAANLLSAGD